tara:strand:- start:116 stop:889 length:774 start_codon:yes stop_codon:yes gene_type:complete
MNKMRQLIVIPARLSSWRFPNKPLTDLLSMPMFEHVYRRSELVSNIDDIVLALCDKELYDIAVNKGMKAIMTSNEHKTACERVAEASQIMGYTSHDDIVINVQADEPVVPPPVIEITRDLLLSKNTNNCANLVEHITDTNELNNRHRVKAILSVNNNLIFLSRESVPSTFFDINKLTTFYRLTCITAYRGPFLQQYCKLSRTPIELIEGNDMMRVIEHDIQIPSGISPYRTHPVDTPEDVKGVINILKNDEWYDKYK